MHLPATPLTFKTRGIAALLIAVAGLPAYQAAPPSHLILSEFVASNGSGLQDEDGDYSDWFEIRNPTGGAVNLEGISVTDDPLVPGKWTFPAVDLASESFLVVFASGKNRKPTDGGELHTNFRLERTGEYFALYQMGPAPEVLSEFLPVFPEQRADISYGFFDSTGDYRFFANPTPGGPNQPPAYIGFLPEVMFSAHRGFYDHPGQVSLSMTQATGTIRYTVDGSLPSATHGETYQSPVQVTQTLVLRAAAFQEGYFPSSVRTHTYLINVDPTLKLLPVMSLATDQTNLTGPTGIVGMSDSSRIAPNPNSGCSAWSGGDNLPLVYYNPSKRGRAWERPVSAEWILPTDNSGFQADCGIRVNGSDHSRLRQCVNSKFSYRLYFRETYGPANLAYPLIEGSPLLERDKLVLRAGLDDRINPFIRDELTRRVWADMGYPAVLGTFAHLFVNGEYKGYYNPAERPDQQFLQEWFQTDTEWDVVKRQNDVVDGDSAAWNELLTFAIPFVTGTEPGVYAALESRLDLVNFIDYLLLNLYAATWDWPDNNWVAYRERTPGSKFRFLTWDAEGAWGYDGQSSNYNGFREDLNRVTGSNREIPRLYRTLVRNATFVTLFQERVLHLFYGSGALTEENIQARYEELASILGPVIPNFDQLPNNDYPDLDDDYSIGTFFLPRRRNAFMIFLQTEGFDPGTPTPTATASITPTPTSTVPETPTPTATPTPEASDTPTSPPTRSTDLNGDNRVDAKDLLILLKEMRRERE